MRLWRVTKKILLNFSKKIDSVDLITFKGGFLVPPKIMYLIGRRKSVAKLGKMIKDVSLRHLESHVKNSQLAGGFFTYYLIIRFF